MMFLNSAGFALMAAKEPPTYITSQRYIVTPRYLQYRFEPGLQFETPAPERFGAGADRRPKRKKPRLLAPF